MGVFVFRKELISEYARFPRSFTRIHAADILQAVDEAYAGGRFWPGFLIQLNLKTRNARRSSGSRNQPITSANPSW